MVSENDDLPRFGLGNFLCLVRGTIRHNFLLQQIAGLHKVIKRTIYDDGFDPLHEVGGFGAIVMKA